MVSTINGCMWYMVNTQQWLLPFFQITAFKQVFNLEYMEPGEIHRWKLLKSDTQCVCVCTSFFSKERIYRFHHSLKRLSDSKQVKKHSMASKIFSSFCVSLVYVSVWFSEWSLFDACSRDLRITHNRTTSVRGLYCLATAEAQEHDGNTWGRNSSWFQLPIELVSLPL